MARDLTAEELVFLRDCLEKARNPNPTTQISNMLTVLDALVDHMGESADLTLKAREAFKNAQHT